MLFFGVGFTGLASRERLLVTLVGDGCEGECFEEEEISGDGDSICSTLIFLTGDDFLVEERLILDLGAVFLSAFWDEVTGEIPSN